METIIASVIEKSLVGGAFIYLLYMFTTKFNTTLEKIADTLVHVSNTLNNLDERVKKLEGEKRDV
jgi:hypothetical protein